MLVSQRYRREIFVSSLNGMRRWTTWICECKSLHVIDQRLCGLFSFLGIRLSSESCLRRAKEAVIRCLSIHKVSLDVFFDCLAFHFTTSFQEIRPLVRNRKLPFDRLCLVLTEECPSSQEEFRNFLLTNEIYFYAHENMLQYSFWNQDLTRK
jgi:hypothetical protein